MARKLKPEEMPDFSETEITAGQFEETDADRFLRELAEKQSRPLDLTSDPSAWFSVFVPRPAVDF